MYKYTKYSILLKKIFDNLLSYLWYYYEMIKFRLRIIKLKAMQIITTANPY